MAYSKAPKQDSLVVEEHKKENKTSSGESRNDSTPDLDQESCLPSPLSSAATQAANEVVTVFTHEDEAIKESCRELEKKDRTQKEALNEAQKAKKEQDFLRRFLAKEVEGRRKLVGKKGNDGARNGIDQAPDGKGEHRLRSKQEAKSLKKEIFFKYM